MSRDGEVITSAWVVECLIRRESRDLFRLFGWQRFRDMLQLRFGSVHVFFAKCYERNDLLAPID